MANETGNELNVWVYGKKSPGWYCAMWGFNSSYAEHLKSLGYRVEISQSKPKAK